MDGKEQLGEQFKCAIQRATQKRPEMLQTEGKADRRRELRDPLSVSVSILFTEHDGGETLMRAQLLDISVSGARLSIPRSIPILSEVTFYYLKFGIGGRGTVRFCRAGNEGYEVGLEFPNGTGWSPALRETIDVLNLAALSREHPLVPETPVNQIAPEANLGSSR